MKRFVQAVSLVGLLALIFVPNFAYASTVVVGANLTINPEQLPSQQQESILTGMHAAGVQNLRMSLRDNQQSIEFAQRAYAHGMKIDWIALPIKTGEWPVPPDNMKDLWHEKALSASDVEQSRESFQHILSNLDAKGIPLAAIELDNEINWAGFNADFPLPGKGVVFGLDALVHDPEGQQIAKGFLQYLKVLAALKDARDHSKVNQHTPLISAGLADQGGEDTRIGKKADAVSVTATLEFLRAHGLDQLVDGYGVHLYPNAKGVGTSEGAAMRLSNLNKSTFAECRPPGSAAGKPCWLTEWGSRIGTSDACPATDEPRTMLVREMREDFSLFAQQGRLGGIFFYNWTGNPRTPVEDHFSAFRCGSLTESGRLAIAPM